MAVTNLYSNLPGHLVEFKDGGLQLTVDEADVTNSKSLLILGTAYDGPVNEPVKIDSTTVTQLFGSEVNDNGYSNGATLTKYAKQAFKNGFQDVRCMRVTGSQASVDIVKVSETIEHENYENVGGTIEGSAAFTETLGHVLIDNLVIKTMNGDMVSGTIVDTLEGTVKFSQNAVTKNSTLDVTYDYKDISAKQTQSNVAVGDGSGNFVDIATTSATIFVTDKDSNTGAYITDNANTIPETDGIVVTYKGTTLVKDTDYTVDSSNNVKILQGNTQNIADGDEVDIEYYTYTVQNYTGTIQCPNDTDQTVTLTYEPVETILSINGTTVDASKFSVAGKVVTLPAGNFNVDDTYAIRYKYITTEEITEGITVTSLYGGSIYKEANVKVEPYTAADGSEQCKFIFTKPASKLYTQTEQPFYFSSEDVPTVGMLKIALGDYALNNVFDIITDDEDMSTANFPAFDSDLVDGGDDGVNVTNNEMFEALAGKRNGDGYLTEQGAYQILENYHVDYIYPAGVYADAKQTVNPNSSFHHELALLCAVLTYRTKMTHGFIDVKPNSNTTLVGIQKYVENLLTYDNDHYMKDSDGNEIVDSEGNKMDIGWYTSIVVGPEPVMVSDTLGTYYGSPALAYAALCASLKPQSAPTNKALTGVKGMKYKFSNKQMNELVGNRMVVFKLKNEGTTTASSTPYVVDGCTAGNSECDYRRIATVKVVTDVVDQIREVSDPFIGEPNTVEQRNALSALISKRLTYLLNEGEIQYYAFEINATVQQVLLGECTISLTLVVPQELRKITTVVALRATA